jgi:hypothetical protein
MNLNFIAYIINHYCWWSFHYILNHAKHERQMQDQDQSITHISLKILETSPPLISIVKMGEEA